MNPSQSIRTQTPTNITLPDVNIQMQDDFTSLIHQRGYDIIWEKAIRCPCSVSPDNKPSCMNCHGLGWVFVDAVRTKAIIKSINKSTKYKDWSPELVGTISVTVDDSNILGTMDKITIDQQVSVFTEVVRIRTYNNAKFVFLTYKPQEIKHAYLFNGDGNLLTIVGAVNYVKSTKNEFLLYINPVIIPANSNNYISLRYTHYTSYNVIDLPNDMRITEYYDSDGKRTVQDMPVQAVARKSQYELGVPSSMEGDDLLINDPIVGESIDFNFDFKNDFKI